jgi:hypothetical protein
MRNLAVIGAAALLACAAPAAPSCRAVAPAPIAGGAATWIGPCANGRAEGVGTLRVARSTGTPGLFYGRMTRGRPFSGVMATPEGDWRPAWRFDAALRPRDDPSGERQSSIATFRLAEAGAAEASRRYRAAGNAASARFHADQGRRLAEALD